MSEESQQILENLMSALGDNPSETINNMLSSLSSKGATEEEGKQEGLPIDFDMLLKVGGLMEQLSNDKQDERSTLLCALKPFLSEERQPQIDKAIKLLKLSSFAKTARDLDLFKNLL